MIPKLYWHGEKAIGKTRILTVSAKRNSILALSRRSLQYTLGDKLFPRFLSFTGEKAGPMIDNLNKLEKLQFVPSTARWLAMQALRNKLVHEYLEDEFTFSEALNTVNQFVDEMLKGNAPVEGYFN